jgi:hypothetical protein
MIPRRNDLRAVTALALVRTAAIAERPNAPTLYCRRFGVRVLGLIAVTVAALAAALVGPSPKLASAQTSGQLLEGNDARYVEVIVPINWAGPEALIVPWQTEDGTATVADGDYGAASGEDGCAAACAAFSIWLPVNGDIRDEPDEWFNIILAPGPGQFKIQIILVDDDDPDTTPPPPPSLPDITRGAISPEGAVVQFSTGFTHDDVDGRIDGVCNPPSGSFFPMGTTTVTCSYTDLSGNSSFDEFLVIVEDQGPVVVPRDLTVPEGNSGEQQVQVKIDILGPAPTIDYYTQDGTATTADGDYVHATGTMVGTVFVYVTVKGDTKFEPDETFTIQIGYGLFATITIQNDDANPTPDTTPPTVQVPADITVPATGPSGAVVTYAVTATDDVDHNPFVSCNPASGSTFPQGTTAVVCTATDSAGNTGVGSFDVLVGDATPPVVTDPADIVKEATGPAGAVATFTIPTATDDTDGVRPVTCTKTSGATFPLGVTTVTCSASDTAGNSGSSSFTITVRDTTKPIFANPPAAIEREATSASGAVITYTSPTATDLVSGSIVATCGPPSGTTFPIATSTVVCVATDSSGNAAQVGFQVTVHPNTPPTVTVPSPITVEATGPTGAVVTYAASATDSMDGARPVTCTPTSGNTFSLGTTTVSCTATDSAGTTGSASFTITVQDTTAPILSLPKHPTVDATSPNGARVSFRAEARDLIDGSIAATCDPARGSWFPVGATTVTCTATDAGGNTVSGSFTVTVVGPTQLLAQLIARVETLPTGASLESELVAKLQAAQTAIAAGSTTTACGQLGAFTGQVGIAMRSQTLSIAAGKALLAEAGRIQTILGC